jgi:hypothetical protein
MFGKVIEVSANTMGKISGRKIDTPSDTSTMPLDAEIVTLGGPIGETRAVAFGSRRYEGAEALAAITLNQPAPEPPTRRSTSSLTSTSD